MGFWIGIAVGAVLGFGAALALFLPIILRRVRLQDDYDLMVATIDKLKHNLDDLAARRDIAAFYAVENGDKSPLNGRKMLSREPHGRR